MVGTGLFDSHTTFDSYLERKGRLSRTLANQSMIVLLMIQYRLRDEYRCVDAFNNLCREIIEKKLSSNIYTPWIIPATPLSID